jgi:alpha-tubulin suppressor-like RCC1 family protein
MLISSDGANADADISYSVSGGPFIICALVNSSATGLSTAPHPGISHTVYWNSVANGAGLSGAVNVIVKVDASGTPGTTESFSVINTDHNAPPSANVTTPSGTKYGNIRIDYLLLDAESNNCSIIAYFSANNGASWSVGTMAGAGDGIVNLSATPGGTSHVFYWDSRADNVAMNASNSQVKFRVVPFDAFNQGASGDTNAFTVNNTIVNYPPTVSITSGPANGSTITVRDATFTWTGSDNDGTVTGYYYSLDHDPPDIFTTSTTQQFSNLSNVEHVFRITAQDNSGALSATASRTFTVNYNNIPPTVTITGGPSGNTTDDTPTFTYSGSDSDGAISGYYVSIDENPPNTWTGSTSWTTPSLSVASHTFRVIAVDDGGANSSVASRVFSVVLPLPSPASAPNPGDYGQSVSLTAQLSWTAGKDAEGYNVYFGTSSPGTLKGYQTQTTYNPGALNPGTTYFWRIDSVNSSGSATGTVWRFRTVFAPGMPQNPSPADGAVGVSISSGLSWSASTGADNYTVYFGQTPTPPFLCNTAATSASLGPLSYGTTYYWEVCAHNSAGSTQGPLWYFRTQEQPPDAAGNPFPADGAQGASLRPTLTWSAANRAAGYYVHFGTSPSPPYRGNTGNTYFNPGCLKFETTYYWKVVPYNTGGNASSITTWSFGTMAKGADVPPVVEFVSPDLFEVIECSSVTIEWVGTDSDGYITGYFYQLDNTTLYKETTETSMTLTQLSLGEHYFCVRAIDDAGINSAVVSIFFSINYNIYWENEIAGISAGGYDSLALLNNGSVVQWGSSLGSNGKYPRLVAGLSSVTQISAGYIHFVALLSNGSVVSWGHNEKGQLGDGTTNYRANPIIVPGITDASQVAAGSYHTLALLSNGSLLAWGKNDHGQIGDGTTIQRNNPTVIPNISGVSQLAGGGEHTLVLLLNGSMLAFGYNIFGQIGDGTTVQRENPTIIPDIADVSRIACGNYHNLALLSNGSVLSWGYNMYRQLGDGTGNNHYSPIIVPGITEADNISAGESTSMATISNGSMIGWGWNINGQVDDKVSSGCVNPIIVSGISQVRQADGGTLHTLALLSNGSLLAWGDNFYGQLGDGTMVKRNVPLFIPTTSALSKIESGGSDSFSILTNGSILGWGLNDYGELGIDSYDRVIKPAIVPGISDAAQVKGCHSHTTASLNNGSVLTWGCNVEGQLGDGTTVSRPFPGPVPGLTGVSQIAVGSGFNLASLSNGSVCAWGSNASGQLGDGTISPPKCNPIIIPGISGISQLSAGYNHSLALLLNGSVLAWGSNSYGQLGDGTTTDNNRPLLVPGITGACYVEGGGYDSFAILSNGSVLAWGSNMDGQLGDGTTAQRNSPVIVPGIQGIAKLSMSSNHTLALLSNGSVLAWGDNYYGQLGDGTTTSRYRPIIVPGVNDAVEISGGIFYSLVILSDGSLMGWGHNEYGQLGLYRGKVFVLGFK